jgi:flavin-dependent dehydrogenase
VLLVDQATFPRDKVCGDGVAYSGLAVLARMGLLDWATNSGFSEPQELLLTSPDGVAARDRPDLHHDLSYGCIIPRLVLDAVLVERAVTAGARLKERTRITSMERLKPHRIHLSGYIGSHAVTLETSLVIAADGGQSSFTRRLGLALHPPELVAVRGYFEGDMGDPGLVEIHWEKPVMPGYGWIFPLGDGRANVGMGAYSSTVRQGRLNLHEQLKRFLTQNSHVCNRLRHARPIGPIKGYPLRTDADRVTPLADNVLVAGEAAGVVNPLTGEGIGPSLVCGEMVAAHARRALQEGDFSAAGLMHYGRALHQKFDAVHRSARILRCLLSYSWVVNRVVRRANRDREFAQLLGRIITGINSPAMALTPSVIVRILVG